MVQKFRKKPVQIEAIQWNGNSNKHEIDAFVGKELKTELENETAYLAGKDKPIFSLLIETKEGAMKAFKGDWIIKEPFPTGDRDFYPCKNDIFQSIYEIDHNGNVMDSASRIPESFTEYSESVWNDLFGILAWKFKPTKNGDMYLDGIAVYNELKEKFYLRRK